MARQTILSSTGASFRTLKPDERQDSGDTQVHVKEIQGGGFAGVTVWLGYNYRGELGEGEVWRMAAEFMRPGAQFRMPWAE